VTSVLGAVAGVSGLLLLAGTAVLASRFHSVQISGLLATSEVSRNYLLDLGAETALVNVGFGVIALLVMHVSGASSGRALATLRRAAAYRAASPTSCARRWIRWLLDVAAAMIQHPWTRRSLDVAAAMIQRPWTRRLLFAMIPIGLLVPLHVWFPLALVISAEASIELGIAKPTWPARAGVAALVVVAITVAQEADRLGFQYERAVITLRPDISSATIFGTRDSSDFHLPTYPPDDLDCRSGRQRVCGLLLASDGGTVTAAPLFLTDPAGAHPIVTIDRADIASVAVYPVSASSDVQDGGARRRPLYCRVPGVPHAGCLAPSMWRASGLSYVRAFIGGSAARR
jgi:hypothetical protein